jgi:hypothetical protein
MGLSIFVLLPIYNTSRTHGRLERQTLLTPVSNDWKQASDIQWTQRRWPSRRPGTAIRAARN